jgi:hypothetical protein
MAKIINIVGKNVYPFSKENFDAVIKYYFINNGITMEGPRSMDLVYKEVCQIELFEFEYLVSCLIENISIFEENLNEKNGLTISNLCSYAIDAYLDRGKSGSKNRQHITNLFALELAKSCN